MQCYYLFWASFVVLLGISISQEVGIPCKENSQCENLRTAPSSVKCIDGYCKCETSNGTVVNCASINVNSSSSSSSSAGEKIVAAVIGRVCSLDKDCVQAGQAACNTTRKQCACNTGFVSTADNMRCLPVVQYLSRGCEISKQCLSAAANTSCIDGTCRCEENFYDYNGTCWIKRGFGSSCNVSEECGHVLEAICDSGKICSCPINRTISPDSRSCLKIASKFDDDCVESIQCTQLLGQNGVCQDKRCKCREQHHHSSEMNKCTINKKVNESCATDHDCLNGKKEGDVTAMRCISTSSSGTHNKTCACPAETEYHDLVAECKVKDHHSAASRVGDLTAFVIAMGYFLIVSIIL